MSAVQQIAAAIGSAAVTSISFAGLESSGHVHAMTVSLCVVIAISAPCLGVVRLLPRKAAEQPPRRPARAAAPVATAR
ncbi:MAG: hypothetical protein M3417_12395 [Actinomycetota bacterium]|nr:hypothetical protein [Actinomycetota bacterium]